MEMEHMISCVVTSRDEDDDIPLPGFRFHPTDEELVGFYLKRKVEKRPISIELIKQIDIYKYDPSNLPKASNVGDQESYFFCKRGRKYRNSVRPNRVITGSGFWKATGIDKPIYSSAINGDQEGRDCIGLKKSLVYYRGSAGKGTKTDWMMHEFRLPAEHDMKTTKHLDAKTIAQEAEVWTLCRIFKRKVSHKKCIPNWKDEIIPAKRNPVDVSSKICSMEYSDYHRQGYINFGDPIIRQNDQKISPLHNEIKKPFNGDHVDVSNQLFMSQISSVSQAPSATSSYSSLTSPDMNELLEHDWDELRSVVEFAVDHPFVS